MVDRIHFHDAPSMKLSALHLKRYREIAALLWKYGRSDLVQQMRKNEDFAVEEPPAAAPGEASPEQLADDLEAMGPTYVKLGQVLAGRPDLLPESYQKALARLQDKVKPFPYEEVERIIMEELGVRISKAFSRFDREPTAAASLGQVHGAALRDGTPVMVKVQRPHIRSQIAEDFEVLAQIAGFLDDYTGFGRRLRLPVLVEEFRSTIQQELNYEREAQNLIAVGNNLKEFELIDVPQPVPGFCTRSVLTMEYVTGCKVTALGPLAQLEIDGPKLAETLFRAYLKQVLIDGLFHADPHPGNVFITTAGHVALLDLGMVGHVAPDMQERLLKLLIAVSDGAGEDVAEIVFRMSEKMEPFDVAAFRHRIAQLVAIRRDQGLRQLNIGRTLLDLSTNARENGVVVPAELVLLGKTLLQLDEVGLILDPTFDPSASVRRHVGEIMAQRMRKDVSKGSLLASLLETKDFVSHLPGRLNRVMDALTNSELEVKVKAVDAKMMLEGMQKIANRITAGILLASLILGASILALVPTHRHLLGYPVLAIVCFLAAATGGGMLIMTILFQDHQVRKKYPH